MRRTFTPEIRKKLSEATKLAIKEGRVSTISQSYRPTPEEQSRLAKENWIKWRADGTAERILEATKHQREKFKKGTHGVGRGERGRADHASCKRWVIRSPDGKEYSFTNLREWVRQNIGLFDDGNPHAKCSHEYRIVSGFSNVVNGAKVCHYRGWSVLECKSLPNTRWDDSEASTS